MITPKIINCGESGTTARVSMLPVAFGAAGEGIFVFTGEGSLPTRPFKNLVDMINAKATASLIKTGNCESFAVPANSEYHMPIKIYVGNGAIRELVQEINEGRYEYFRHALVAA